MTTDVIKHSGAIQVSNSQISFLQRKIWNVLLANAFDLLTERDKYTITIKDLMEILKIHSKDIHLIKEAVTKMQTILVQWNVLEKDDETWTSSQFLGEVTIKPKSGKIIYTWGPELRAKLQNPSMYARISLAIQTKFKGKYALILYELCCDYFIKKQGRGETPWVSIEDFKKLMGVDIDKDKYCAKFKYLNDFVIKKAVKEVNDKSDISIEIKYRKDGKQIVALKFYISPNPSTHNILNRLNREPQQSEIVFEEQKIIMTDRLVKYFLLSETQAKEVLGTMDLDYIGEILDYVQRKKDRGTITKNLGAYTLKALKEDFREKKSFFDLEKEQEAEAKKKEENKSIALEAILKGLVEEYNNYKRQKAIIFLKTKNKTDLVQIENRFGDNLTNAYLKERHQKEGIKGTTIESEYYNFIVSEYLIKEIYSFNEFAWEEKGHIVEKQGDRWILKDPKIAAEEMLTER